MGKLRDNVDSFMNANWTATPVLFDENAVDQLPTDLSPWVSIEFLPYSEEMSSIGARCYRAEGELIFRVWVASGTGSSNAVNLVEQLRDLLRNTNLGDGVRLTTASPCEEGGSHSTGNWESFLTRCYYIHDYQVAP